MAFYVIKIATKWGEILWRSEKLYMNTFLFQEGWGFVIKTEIIPNE